MTELNRPIQIKGLSLRNPIVMAPMCQYIVTKGDGKPNHWHFVHYASRAVGGAGMIIVEATAVTSNGRITNQDLGLWEDSQIEGHKKIVEGIHNYGATAVLQLAHAGRKAQDEKEPVAPSPIAYPFVPGEPQFATPVAPTEAEIEKLIAAFRAAAQRAIKAGYDTVEIHGAHGYLIHQFHSPALNQRDDAYGKDLSLFGTRVVAAVREEIPKEMPLMMRLSAIEYMDGGYDVEHALKMAHSYQKAGVDVFHISSGGEAPLGARKPGNYPGYQLGFAKRFKEEFPDMPIIGVGLLADPAVAEYALQSGAADLVAIGRGMLDDPYWAVHAVLDRSRQKDETLIPRAYAKGIPGRK